MSLIVYCQQPATIDLNLNNLTDAIQQSFKDINLLFGVKNLEGIPIDLLNIRLGTQLKAPAALKKLTSKLSLDFQVMNLIFNQRAEDKSGFFEILWGKCVELAKKRSETKATISCVLQYNLCLNIDTFLEIFNESNNKTSADSMGKLNLESINILTDIINDFNSFFIVYEGRFINPRNMKKYEDLVKCFEFILKIIESNNEIDLNLEKFMNLILLFEKIFYNQCVQFSMEFTSILQSKEMPPKVAKKLKPNVKKPEIFYSKLKVELLKFYEETIRKFSLIDSITKLRERMESVVSKNFNQDTSYQNASAKSATDLVSFSLKNISQALLSFSLQDGFSEKYKVLIERLSKMQPSSTIMNDVKVPELYNLCYSTLESKLYDDFEKKLKNST